MFMLTRLSDIEAIWLMRSLCSVSIGNISSLTLWNFVKEVFQ